MVLSLFLSVHAWDILLILVILFDTLVYPSERTAKCLEIINWLLTVPSTRMPSYKSVTLNYPFIYSRRLLHIGRLPLTIYL